MMGQRGQFFGMQLTALKLGMAYPCQYADLIISFDRAVPDYCIIVKNIYDNFGHAKNQKNLMVGNMRTFVTD